MVHCCSADPGGAPRGDSYALPALFRLSACALLGVSVSAASAQELVVNGGFETGTFAGWSVPPNGPPHLPNPAFFEVSFGGGHSGERYARLSSTLLQFISQDIPTVAGTDYELSFWLRVPGILIGEVFTVRWEGEPVFQEFVGGIQPLPWTQFTVPLTANITGSFLEFGQTAFPGEYHIDDISVVQVPAPGAGALLGMAGLLALPRKRHRQ